MAGVKRKPLMARQNSLNSLHVNPLVDPTHSRSCSEGNPLNKKTPLGNYLSREIMTSEETQDGPKTIKSGNVDPLPEKENLAPNVAPPEPTKSEKLFPDRKSYLKDRMFKPTSLQFCMQNDVTFRSTELEPPPPPTDSKTPNSGNVWVHSDSEAAPASSWSTLPNRALLRRPLPVDIGRCKCMIVKENTPQGFQRGSIYSLYTYEGQGRQNRKLAMAYHRRRNGRSEFVVARNAKGLLCDMDDGFIGSVKANFMGSRYYIRDKGSSTSTLEQPNDLIQGILLFKSTLATWTGSYRSMKAWIPKHKKNLETKNSNQVQLPKGLVKGCKGKMENVYQAVSRAPRYNSTSKQYELDFRDRGQGGLRIQSSVKNLQLYMEETVEVEKKIQLYEKYDQFSLSENPETGERKTDNYSTTGKDFQNDVSNGFQISVDRLPSILHFLGFHRLKALLHNLNLWCKH